MREHLPSVPWILAVAVACLAVLAAPAAHATNGYFTHGYGTITKGMAGAGVALPVDTMIAATNPAGMAFVGKRYDAGLAIFNPNREYKVIGAPSGFPGTFGLIPSAVESDSEYFFIPYFGANWELGPNRTFGFNLYGHGGMNTDYPAATFFASSPTGVDLSQLFITGTYAFKTPSGNHAFGIMPIFAFQQFEIQGVGSFAPFSSNAAKLSNNGKDTSTGFGFKVGYLGQWTPSFSFGASYQSEMGMDEFSDYAGLFAEQGGFDIPSTYTVGVAFKATPQLTVALDVQETMYSDIASVGNPFLPNLVLQPLGADAGAGFGWQDMTTVKLGFQYAPGGPWTWRFGYSSGDQPIPETEVLFNILAPGVMEDHYTFGFSRQTAPGKAWNFSLLYAPSSSVTGDNPLEVPGRQQIELEMNQWDLEVSYSWGF